MSIAPARVAPMAIVLRKLLRGGVSPVSQLFRMLFFEFIETSPLALFLSASMATPAQADIRMIFVANPGLVQFGEHWSDQFLKY